MLELIMKEKEKKTRSDSVDCKSVVPTGLSCQLAGRWLGCERRGIDRSVFLLREDAEENTLP